MHAEVKVTLATPFLSWADFMDAPGFGPEHPDYCDSIDRLEKLNYWLTLDRKELASELVRYYATAKCERTLKERAEQKISQTGEITSAPRVRGLKAMQHAELAARLGLPREYGG